MRFSLGSLTTSAGTPFAFTEAQRRERILSIARVLLAVCCLIAVHLDFNGAGHYAVAAHILLLAYLLHSLVTSVLVQVRGDCGPSLLLSIHGADVLWPVLISLPTGGPDSPCFLLFVFALFGAAYRWGLRATLATTSACITAFLLEAGFVLSRLGQSLHLLPGTFRFAPFVMQVIALAMAGALLGYLAEREEKLRTKALEIGRLVRKVNPEASVPEVLKEVLRSMLGIFNASRIVVALSNTSTGRAFVWELSRGKKAGEDDFRTSELGGAERSACFFSLPGQCWCVRKTHKGAAYQLIALDTKGRRLGNSLSPLPEWFFLEYPVQPVLAATLKLEDEWSGRVFLSGPRDSPDIESDLRFFQSLVAEVAPAVHSVYKLHQLRSRTRAAERARIGRDLHDGVIQSLIALEMQVDVLRRQAANVSSEAEGKLENVQNLLRQEIISLRELMQRLSLDSVAPQQLLVCMADIVDKFQRETGISARFDSDAAEVALPPRVASEVAQIVHEALANVRKHSSARSVQVRLGVEKGCYKLVVADDGQGFDFSGRLTQTELDFSRRGPRVIKERVHSIKGELAIESQPGAGARLEICFAPKAYGQPR